MNDSTAAERPARFLWLPPSLRPPVPLPRRQEITFLLVGTTLLFSGYDLSVYSLALPQIQHSLAIPENALGLTVSYFRLAAFATLLIAPLADIFGRRALLMFTVFFEALFTIATAFAQTSEQYVAAQILARVFGYSEEALCFVVIAEEIDARVRGWSTGTLGTMNATGVGVASLAFALVNVLPFGWRALYVIGGGSLFVLAYFRRWLPETPRFELRRAEIAALESKSAAMLDTLRRLVNVYPGRLAALLVAVFANGFAFAPAAVLASKYLQQTHHYQPLHITYLYLGGGLLSVWGNIFAGRSSDFLGRKVVLVATLLIGGVFFYVLYSGIQSWIVAGAWIVAIFGYLATDALLAGYPAEIFPTAYRATASSLRYAVSIFGGATSLALEGVFYDWLGTHGPAIAVALAAVPVAIAAVLFLPEPARRTLEDVAAEPLTEHKA
ncbi:MAG TPA: MFS transporter [Rhizomicrobium sp.]|nr:MFS transporter [Rhizomicrobium sp.]